MDNNHNEPRTITIAETENFNIWKADEPDGETTYHLELGRATIHFFQEEWDEFRLSADALEQSTPDENGFHTLEFDNVDVWLDDEDWEEFRKLLQDAKSA